MLLTPEATTPVSWFVATQANAAKAMADIAPTRTR
jgi:hypothetical protein